MANENKIEQPEKSLSRGPGNSPGRPEIHVMPEKYLGATLRATLPRPVAALPVSQPGVPAKTAVTAVSAGKPEGPAKGLIIGVLVILALGGVIASVFFWPRPSSKESVTVTPVNLNINQPLAETAPIGTPEIATTTPEIAATTTEEIAALPPKNADDSDADGLTDREEAEIYGTDPANVDSDSDGYLDGGEVFYLYNPAGIAPVTLKESGLVNLFDNPGAGYSLLVPARWRASAAVGGYEFIGSTGEGVSVAVSPNPLNKPMLEWYAAEYPTLDRSGVLQFTNRSGLSGIKSSDGLSAFLAVGDKIFRLRYELDDSPIISYRRSFEMMTNSFKVVLEAEPAATSTPPALETSATGTATSTP